MERFSLLKARRSQRMEDRELLLALAGVAATFIGFAGVVFAVDRSSHRGVSEPERTALLHLLLPAIAVLFLAFAPVVLSARVGSHDAHWRAATGMLGVVHLMLIANATRAAIRARLLEPIPLRFVLIPGGYLAVAANAAVVLGFFQDDGAMIYLAGLVWFLFVSAVQFVMLNFLHTEAT